MLRRSVIVVCLALLLAGLGGNPSALAKQAPCKPVLFFDLGNTLIDTHDFDHIRYFPPTLDYLHDLKKRGYSLNMIANIPEKWGTTYAEKLARLKSEVAKGWADTSALEWDLFDRILLPMNDSERKPAPVLFKRAVAAASGCVALYQGEEQPEIDAARAAGMSAYLVNHPGDPFYLPADQIDLYGPSRR